MVILRTLFMTSLSVFVTSLVWLMAIVPHRRKRRIEQDTPEAGSQEGSAGL